MSKLNLRNAKPADIERVEQVALHLGLDCRPQDDDFIDQVIAAALKKIKRVAARHKPAKAEGLIAVIAEEFHVQFETVRNTAEIKQLQRHYVKQGQYGLAQVDDEFADGGTDALLFRVTQDDEQTDRYVAVINLIHSKHREFWNKIHELVHRLIEPLQKMFVWRRRAERTAPIEQLVDAVAARIAFFEPIFGPLVRSYAANYELSWSTIERIRQDYSPTCSLQAVANAVINFWPRPAMFLTATQRGTKGNSNLRVALRIDPPICSPTAKATGLWIPPSRRVPSTSPLHRAFERQNSVEGMENLSDWTTSRGEALANLPVFTSALPLGDYAYALMRATASAPRRQLLAAAR